MPRGTSTSNNVNGFTNGHKNNGLYDMEDGRTFLFTSESVGEGHPGKCNLFFLF